MADKTQEIKIVIKGDSGGAIGAIKRVLSAFNSMVGALSSVKAAVSKVMGALGVFGLAVQGIQAIVDGYKKLHEWINRASIAASKMRIAEIFREATDAMDTLIDRQKTYNALLQEELASLQRRNELDSIERTDREKQQDNQREIDRNNEIAAAPDDETEKEIRRRWMVEDERIARSREFDRLSREIQNENEKSAIYGSKANASKAAAEEAESAADKLRRNKIRMNPDKRADADKQIDALMAKANELKKSEELYREEERQAEKKAELYSKQRLAIISAPSVAEAKNEAERAKERRDRDDKDFKEKQRKARESSDAAQEFVDNELREQERQRQERQNNISTYYGDLVRQIDNGRPRDRLTAIGLGSGGVVDRSTQEQAANVKTLVQLLKEQVSISRETKHGSYAVYAP